MTKLWKKLLVLVTLCTVLTAGVFAASASSFTDIEGHWAKTYITWNVEKGLFQGTSATTFEPDVTMTRGMFVTVLGRYAGINTDNYKNWYLDDLFTDVSSGSYYAPYVNWAVRSGIVTGCGDGHFYPDSAVTREQMAVMISRFADVYGYNMTTLTTVSQKFADQAQISAYAVTAVERMRKSGILQGVPSGSNLLFKPKDIATRAEVCTVFYRMNQSFKASGKSSAAPTSIAVSQSTATMKPGDTLSLTATITPSSVSNQTVTWVSEDPSIATVSLSGQVTAVSAGTTGIYCYTYNGKGNHCTVSVYTSDGLSSSTESYAEKCNRIFGQYVSDPRRYYSTDTAALADQVTISVRVWDYANGVGSAKVTKTMYLQVHKNIAASVSAIFEEIYQGKEQFPINSLGGWRANAGVSEHKPGLAIDINPNSNYYCSPSGTAIVGTHWSPDTDPYSIPSNGDVVKAMTRYGFTRGIYWHSGYKDYMHFSYFGT